MSINTLAGSEDTTAQHPRASAVGSDPEARIAASIDNWKRKLLDVSKRNRSLNFRVNKVSTVTILDEQPAEVFRQLYIRGKPMRFLATPEEEGSSGVERGEPTDPLGQVFEEEDEALGADFVPYDPQSLGERHTDDWLQTSANPKRWTNRSAAWTSRRGSRSRSRV